MNCLVRAAVAAAASLAVCLSAQAETPLERGTYLVRGVVACGNCHTMQGPQGPVDEMELAGGLKIEDPAFSLVTPNITPDKETGIGNWSDAQIITAIREGKRPDGSLIGPPMPFHFYKDISDEDAQAIVAYLRSVKPVSNRVARNTYNFPLPPAWGPPVAGVAPVSKDDPVKYGKYLAGPLGHCMECHSGPNEMGIPDPVNHLGTGGMKFIGPWGESVSANITPTNLKDWTDEQIKTVIKTGVRPNGTRLLPPMGIAYYANMSDEDLNAIVAYLRTLPPK
jgi:mono/diheme cytochrome c family protein